MSVRRTPTGAMLLRLRNSRGMTQQKCAEKMDCEEVNWRKWELGLRAPSLKSLAYIVLTLDLNSAELNELVMSSLYTKQPEGSNG